MVTAGWPLAPHPYPLSPLPRGEGDMLQGAGLELTVFPSPRLRGEG